MSGDLAGPGAEMLRRRGAGRAMARREAVFALWQGGAALPATAPHRAARAGVRRGSALMADAPSAGAGRSAALTALRAAVASGPPVPRGGAVLPAAVLPAAVWQRGWTQAGAAAVSQAQGAAGRLWTAPQGGAAAGPVDWAGRDVAPGGGAMAPGVSAGAGRAMGGLSGEGRAAQAAVWAEPARGARAWAAGAPQPGAALAAVWAGAGERATAGAMLPAVAPVAAPAPVLAAEPGGFDEFRAERWLSDQLARAVGGPQQGSALFDPGVSPRWPGGLQRG